MGFDFVNIEYDGRYNYRRKPEIEEGVGIEEGRKRLEEEPEKWIGLQYQSNMVTWPVDQQKYRLYDRGSGMHVKEQHGGAWTFIEAKYTVFGPASFSDNVCEQQEMCVHGGQVLEWKRCGRGEGIADVPGLKLFGDIDPDDIKQGAVGNCWLVSAISALAEFEGAVKALFKEDELNEEGLYHITLFDLPTQQWKEYKIDDRLACKPEGGLLSLHLTADNELWPLLLEKAMAYHGAGWDAITGGWSNMAFVALTGCTDAFTIQNTNEGKHVPPQYIKLPKEWEKFEENNCSCPKARQGSFRAKFPNGKEVVDAEYLFDLLCEYDAKNFLVCAGTGAGSDTNNTDGIVDGHAYSVISAKKAVCGKFDMLLFRNPHGQTEFRGGWKDGGEMWAENPDVKAALKHEENPDDGLFWMDKDDAFKYFHSFYVCCKSMEFDKVPKHKDKPPEVVKNREDTPDRFHQGFDFDTVEFDGSTTFSRQPAEENGVGVEEGKAKLMQDPERWGALLYQTDMEDHPACPYSLFDRTCEARPANGPQPGAGFTFLKASFKAFGPASFTDKVCDQPFMSMDRGRTLEWKRCGRGEGLVDVPSIKLFGDVDPDDIKQGTVGDCWLVSAISALAEFDGEVMTLFKESQLNEEGLYHITLYDLPTKKFKEYKIDDRLACIPGQGLLSLQPTADSELWPLLLEKALCYHAGGWNKIDGGVSTMAFVALTGCTDTFTIQNTNEGSGQPPTYVKLQPDWDAYEENNCHCPTARSGMPMRQFPNGEREIGPDDLFDLLCEWDAQNYVVCAGTGAGSDTNNTDGIVDGHAYSVISAKKAVCGKFDMLLFRNPHGQTEFEGGWRDGGEMWAENPDVKAALKHEENPDDGLFWMDKDDAFKYFHSFFVCCKSMEFDKMPKHEGKSEEVKKAREDPIEDGEIIMPSMMMASAQKSAPTYKPSMMKSAPAASLQDALKKGNILSLVTTIEVTCADGNTLVSKGPAYKPGMPMPTPKAPAPALSKSSAPAPAALPARAAPTLAIGPSPFSAFSPSLHSTLSPAGLNGGPMRGAMPGPGMYSSMIGGPGGMAGIGMPSPYGSTGFNSMGMGQAPMGMPAYPSLGMGGAPMMQPPMYSSMPSLPYAPMGMMGPPLGYGGMPPGMRRY